MGEQRNLVDAAKREVARWGKLLHCPKAGHSKTAVGGVTYFHRCKYHVDCCRKGRRSLVRKQDGHL